MSGRSPGPVSLPREALVKTPGPLFEARQKERDHLAARTHRRETNGGGMGQRSKQAIRTRPSDDNEGRLRAQHALVLPPRAGPGYVEHQVVALVAAGEIVFGVIDDGVRSYASD